MKKLVTLICLLAVTTFTQAQLADGSYPLVTNQSIITWKVDYAIGTKGHEGTLKLISGTMMIKNGTISGGNFVIDMTSVHATDMKSDQGSKDLDDHLQGTDFLSTEEFPKGFFTVLNAVKDAPEKFTVTGYLIIKGISNSITFPVAIINGQNVITIKSQLILNRTKWGINYHSGSIFNTMKDGIISDDMNMTLDLNFKKAQ